MVVEQACLEVEIPKISRMNSCTKKLPQQVVAVKLTSMLPQLVLHLPREQLPCIKTWTEELVTRLRATTRTDNIKLRVSRGHKSLLPQACNLNSQVAVVTLAAKAI